MGLPALSSSGSSIRAAYCSDPSATHPPAAPPGQIWPTNTSSCCEGASCRGGGGARLARDSVTGATTKLKRAMVARIYQAEIESLYEEDEEEY